MPADLSIGDQAAGIQTREALCQAAGIFYLHRLSAVAKSGRQLRPMLSITADTTVFLLTGIANPGPLVQHIKSHTPHIIHHNYPDHHRFTLKNITKLADEFSACASKNKMIITTEKDAQRLVEHELLPLLEQLPVLVLPIGIEFLNNGAAAVRPISY